MFDDTAVEDWARGEFGGATLGDARRTARLVRMAATMAASPGGKVGEVFRTSAERQGAYDFLANEAICADSLVLTVGRATAQRCAEEDWVHVVVDGTSLKLTDRFRAKDFGAIGATNLGARGLKVVHAYAVRQDGIPLGVLNQQWWNRVASKKRSDCDDRPLEGKETVHWVRTIAESVRELSQVGTRAWFQIDREGDRFWTLKSLHDSGQWFTVRSTYAHRFVVDSAGRHRVRLRDIISATKPRYERTSIIRRTWERKERRAHFEVRTASVVLDMIEAFSDEGLDLPVTVIDVREVRTTPRGETPIHWRLLTNHPVITQADVEQVIEGYTHRWSIEDLHRAWKSGVCHVEEAQLRSTHRVVKWAVLSIAVAARVERLKALARMEPEQPALTEMTTHELLAIRLLLGHAKRTEKSADEVTLGQAVSWIAELGGYTGAHSGGPPGTTTIKRGLERIAPVALALRRLQDENRMR